MCKAYLKFSEVPTLSYFLLTVTTLRLTPVLGIDDTAAERRKKREVLPEPHRVMLISVSCSPQPDTSQSHETNHR